MMRADPLARDSDPTAAGTMRRRPGKRKRAGRGLSVVAPDNDPAVLRDLRQCLGRVGDLTPREAIALQQRARHCVVREGRPELRTVAGVDVSIRCDLARACVVLLTIPRLEVIAMARAEAPVRFPYVPGLLACREVPVVLAAFASLGHRPDLLMVDGHGLAHPRRFGLACHLGVALDLPTVGVGKTRFVGSHRQPGRRRGCCVRLLDGPEVLGSVLRTRDGVAPVYVSIGHRIDLGTAARLVLRCCTSFRLPEPIRAAHRGAGSVESGTRVPGVAAPP